MNLIYQNQQKINFHYFSVNSKLSIRDYCKKIFFVHDIVQMKQNDMLTA